MDDTLCSDTIKIRQAFENAFNTIRASVNTTCDEIASTLQILEPGDLDQHDGNIIIASAIMMNMFKIINCIILYPHILHDMIRQEIFKNLTLWPNDALKKVVTRIYIPSLMVLNIILLPLLVPGSLWKRIVCVVNDKVSNGANPIPEQNHLDPMAQRCNTVIDDYKKTIHDLHSSPWVAV